MKINIWLQIETREFRGLFSPSHKTQLLHVLQKSATLESSHTVCLLLICNCYTGTKIYKILSALVWVQCPIYLYVELSSTAKSDLTTMSSCLHCSPLLTSSHTPAFPSSGWEGLCNSTLCSLTSTWPTQYNNANTLLNVKARRGSSIQGNVCVTGNYHLSVWGAAVLTQPIIKFFLWHWSSRVERGDEISKSNWA